jgi:hypothetical protein
VRQKRFPKPKVASSPEQTWTSESGLQNLRLQKALPFPQESAFLAPV